MSFININTNSASDTLCAKQGADVRGLAQAGGARRAGGDGAGEDVARAEDGGAGAQAPGGGPGLRLRGGGGEPGGGGAFCQHDLPARAPAERDCRCWRRGVEEPAHALVLEGGLATAPARAGARTHTHMHTGAASREPGKARENDPFQTGKNSQKSTSSYICAPKPLYTHFPEFWPTLLSKQLKYQEFIAATQSAADAGLKILESQYIVNFQHLCTRTMTFENFVFEDAQDWTMRGGGLWSTRTLRIGQA